MSGDTRNGTAADRTRPPKTGRPRVGLTGIVITAGGILLATAVISSVTTLVAVTHLRSTSDEVRAADQRIALANQLERVIVDIETGQRGYVITGQRSFLQPRTQALAALPSLRAKILRLEQADGSPQQMALLRGLFAKLGSYLRNYSDPLVAHADFDLGSARQIVVAGRGKRRVDRMRSLLAIYTRRESRQAEAQSVQADDSSSSAILFAILGLFTVPILILALVWAVSRSVAAPLQRVAGAARRLRRGDLEARVPETGAGEVRALAATFNEMADSLQDSIDRSEREAALNSAILESAQDAYVAVDEDGRVLRWNHQAEELYGIPVEDAIGHRVADLVLADEEAKRTHDERRKAIMAAARDGQAVERYEVTARGDDGSPIQVEVSAAAVNSPSGSIVTYFSRDVTDRARREEEHFANDAVSRAMAATTSTEDVLVPIIEALCRSFDWPVGGFWQYDVAAGLVRCERIWIDPDFEFPELVEYSRQIVYAPGRPLPEYPVLKEAWDLQAPRWEAPRGAAPPDEPRAVAHAAGLRGSLALPVKSGRKMLGMLTFGSKTDVPPDGRRLAALRSIAELIGQVLERRAAQEEAGRLKDEFFALVSHELRTPLTSITGYLDIVREEEAGPVNEEQRRFLDVIDRNAKRLKRLVGDLLFVAQVEAGKLALQKREVELEPVARNAVEAARPRADKQGVLLVAETEPVHLDAADADRLGQLVDNLVSNAIKFTPEGGTVTVRLQNACEEAVLEVTDTGMGISEQDQRNLFDRFYRTEDASKLAIPGIGLGLSITKAIVQGHGGSIAVRSKEGHGTTFEVRLPVAAPGEAQAEPALAVGDGDRR